MTVLFLSDRNNLGPTRQRPFVKTKECVCHQNEDYVGWATCLSSNWQYKYFLLFLRFLNILWHKLMEKVVLASKNDFDQRTAAEHLFAGRNTQHLIKIYIYIGSIPDMVWCLLCLLVVSWFALGYCSSLWMLCYSFIWSKYWTIFTLHHLRMALKVNSHVPLPRKLIKTGLVFNGNLYIFSFTVLTEIYLFSINGPSNLSSRFWLETRAVDFDQISDPIIIFHSRNMRRDFWRNCKTKLI